MKVQGAPPTSAGGASDQTAEARRAAATPSAAARSTSGAPTPAEPMPPLATSLRLRSTSLVLPSLLLLTDLLVLECAFLCVYWVRFLSGWFAVPKGVPDLRIYLLGSIGVLAVFVGLLYAHGMYDLRRRRGLLDDIGGLLRCVVEAMLLLAAATFFYREYSFSRTFLVGFAAASYGFLLAGRVFSRYLQIIARGLGVGVERVAILGRGAAQARLVNVLRSKQTLGYALVGEVLDRSDNAGELPVLGLATELPDVVDRHRIDLVLVAYPFHDVGQLLPVLDALADHQVRVCFVPDLEELLSSKLHVQDIEGLPFVELRQVALTGIGRILKRTFDLVLSALFLVLLAPMLAAIAVAIRLSSRGPVLYRQQRVGRDGRIFQMIKFRTMYQDAERVTGPVFATAADPRRTRVGGWMRAFSLDELPQLYNVLRGDMSLVGPRPERPVFVQEFRASIPRYFERHKVRSGITGWAQVNGLRGDTPLEERTRYDIYYVENWSLGLDLKILAMTLRSVLSRHNAY
jgi:exopolysaccharide biosynthesis polyprenyl glycosylphosphotransferase